MEVNFVPITVDILESIGDSIVDIYILRNGDTLPVLFRSKNYPLGESDWNELKKQESLRLVVREDEAGNLDQRFEESLVEIVQNDEVEVEEKCEAVYNISYNWMQRVFDSSNPEYVFQTSEQLLPSVLDVIFSDHKAAHNFIVKASVDYALYSHSLNVCLFGVGLAHRMLGISKQEALTRYGPGFLWHDLGKLLIPKELWDKEDDTEGAMDIDSIREHTIKGVEMVRDFTDLSDESEAIILHHHERLDGSGYPFGLRGDDISMGARICAVVDRFDHLSTSKEEQERLVSFEALKQIREETPNRFDEDVFKEFLLMFLLPSEAQTIHPNE
jgi:HD-GYP domain-containing protein (c-di-GMP phosphodiesterase class II)